MGRIVNTFQLIEQTKGNINSRYGICVRNKVDVENTSIARKHRKYKGFTTF